MRPAAGASGSALVPSASIQFASLAGGATIFGLAGALVPLTILCGDGGGFSVWKIFPRKTNNAAPAASTTASIATTMATGKPFSGGADEPAAALASVSGLFFSAN